MRRLILTLICLAVPALGGRAAVTVDFKRDIQPIFERRCAECHGEKKQKSGLRFDRKSTVFGGADSGQAIVVAGNSARSPLIERVTTTDLDELMPPKGERLTDAEVALLKTWIEQGAAWPEDAAAGKTHWAYVKSVQAPLPAVMNSGWPRNAIDFHVLKKLEAEGLKPAPEADRATLIRRVSLDLIGLPPTLPEVDRFVADSSTNAFQKVVERLLASPRFGERWARPWLDLARYADTQGYEKDNRRTMWPWRDWVVAALNRNEPFDQFTIEQIAGDLLPDATQEQKVATGFHRNTMTNTEGGTDDEEFRHEAVVDRVNTTLGAWMATTINCAQCHNHKYDPFTMKEYYQLYAFLNTTADSDRDDERPTMKVPTPAQAIELAARTKKREAAERKFAKAAAAPGIVAGQEQWEQRTVTALTNWQVLDAGSLISTGGATIAKQPGQSLLVSGLNPSNDTYQVNAVLPPGRVTGLRLEVLETGELKTLGRGYNSQFVLSRVEAALVEEGQTNPVKFSRATADFSAKDFNVTNLLAGQGKGWTISTSDPRTRVRRSAYFTFDGPIDARSNAVLSITLLHSEKYAGANLMRFRLSTTSGEQVGPPAGLPDDVRAILLAGKRDAKQRKALKEHFQQIAPDLKEVREAQAAARKAEKEWNDSIPIVSVMQEAEKRRETHMMIRGSFLNKGERVSPGVPAVLHALPTNQPPDRLAFARWLVDTNNPLTARVIMNRFWDQIFGIGIVETSEDFGTQGEPPSHPELLDWLAVEFMRAPGANEPGQAWDMKRMLRTIVTSATYRQSAHATPELLQRDPYNRLLARGPRRRLEAEMIRDQALAVSGLLSSKLGGRPVMPPQPDGVWQVVYSGDKWETSKGEDRYRRGLYTFWRRTSPYPSMVSFDAPSREFCVVRRTRSNTPLQALTLLNDPVYVEAAHGLAQRMLAEGGTSPEERAAYGLRLCLARHPKPAEVQRLVKLAEEQTRRYAEDSAAAAKLVQFASADRKNAAVSAELAAWTVVANVLMNMDEFIMAQ
jgi:hypothetical protein